MKNLVLLLVVLSFAVVGCAGMQSMDTPVEKQVVEHVVKVEFVGDNGGPQKMVVKDGDKIIKSMEVRQSGYKLSLISAVYGNKLYIKLFSGLSVADVTRAWQDLIVMENEYPNVNEVHLYINSPGGDAFSGLALADQIEKYRNKGYRFVAHATGIVASAAVPVFTVCNETHATLSTVFMVHEAALWKWPGRESASDIRAQGRLMDLLQALYIDKLVRHSNLDFTEWCSLEKKTEWFSVFKAEEMGILDHIDADGQLVEDFKELLKRELEKKNKLM